MLITPENINALKLATEAKNDLMDRIKDAHEIVCQRVVDRVFKDKMHEVKVIRDGMNMRTGFIMGPVRVIVETTMDVRPDCCTFDTVASAYDIEDAPEDRVILTKKEQTVFWSNIPGGRHPDQLH